MKIRKVLNYCICGKYWVWSKIFEKRKLSNGKNGHIFLHVIKLKQSQHAIYYIFWRNIIIAYSECVSTHVGEFLFIFSSLKWTSGLSLYFMFYHICFWSLFQRVWRWFSACCMRTQVWILSICIQKLDMVVCTFNLSIWMVWGTRTKRSRKILRACW